MPDDANPAGQPVKTEQVEPGVWGHFKNVLTDVNNQFHFFVSLPVITALGSALVGHFQYIFTYAEKVKTETHNKWPRRRPFTPTSPRHFRRRSLYNRYCCSIFATP